MILYQVSFQMKVLISFKELGSKVFRAQLHGCPQKSGEGTFRVRAHQCDGPSAVGLAFQQVRGNTGLFHILLEKISKLIATNLANKTSGYTQTGQSMNGVGCRTSTGLLPVQIFGGPG